MSVHKFIQVVIIFFSQISSIINLHDVIDCAPLQQRLMLNLQIIKDYFLKFVYNEFLICS